MMPNMRKLPRQQLNLRGKKPFRGNGNKRLIIIVHDSEHIDVFEPFPNLFEHLDLWWGLAGFL